MWPPNPISGSALELMAGEGFSVHLVACSPSFLSYYQIQARIDSMPTVEIAGFPLVHGVSMASIGDDPSSDAAVRIKEWSEAIVKQKGYQAASFGTVEENPTDLVAIIGTANHLSKPCSA